MAAAKRKTESKMVARFMKEMDWNVRQCAEFMGVPYRTLYRWIAGENVHKKTAWRIERGLLEVKTYLKKMAA